MINKAIIIGNLGADPELRYTQSETAVCNFSVATTDRYTDKDGERQESTEWHRIVVWGKQAESCEKYLSKGKKVYIEGKIQHRSYEDKEGVTKYVTEIVANNVTFLSPKGEGGGSSDGGGGGQSGGDLPF